MKNNYLLKPTFIFFTLIFSAFTVYSQQEVTGVVYDENENPLLGVNVVLQGTNQGTITNFDGEFTLNVTNVNEDVLVFSFVGYATKSVSLDGRAELTISLEPDDATLDEVVLVGFGSQRKTEVVGSITTINPEELRTTSSNLTTALAGRLAGVIGYQRSGEPGADNAEFFIRGVTTFGYKKDPLILIDNIEVTSTDLARLNPDDIASFSIMKDATATALYGARGANGVVFVTTKEGIEGEARITLRVENSFSAPTRNVELADPVTYMRLNNEALLTRDPLAPLLYSDDKIENTVLGSGSLIYPSTDWREELFKDYAMNQRAHLSVRGGGEWLVILCQDPLIRITACLKWMREIILIIILT
jgi:TonB-linked SusC/RagA family outer membrane protein